MNFIPRFLPLAISLVSTLSFIPTAGAALIVNGSFENNSAGSNIFNPSNTLFTSTLSNVTAYGIREGIDIQTVGSGFGLAPVDGNWKVSPASDAGGSSEEFSMDLTGSLVIGQSYELSFFIEQLSSGVFNGGTVDIGLSTSPNSFGTQIASATAPDSGWLLSSSIFVAPNMGSFLTVRVTDDINSWVGLDDFVLDVAAVPVPAAVWLFGSGLLGLIGVAKQSKK